jgi:hypothetical protein
VHDRGYNFFNFNKLTYTEINLLIDAFNQREKEKEREMKKHSRKKRKW